MYWECRKFFISFAEDNIERDKILIYERKN